MARTLAPVVRQLCIAAIILSLFLVGSASAAFSREAFDHEDGALADPSNVDETDYGLRVDISNSDKHVFSFEANATGTSSVLLTLYEPGDTLPSLGSPHPLDFDGLLQGTIKHRDHTTSGNSGELWSLTATLKTVIYTLEDNTEDWRSSSPGATTIYDIVLNDFEANADDSGGSGGQLKSSSFAADRIAFDIVTVEMVWDESSDINGIGPDFNPTSLDSWDPVTNTLLLYDFPNTSGTLPFMFTIGHRLPPTEDVITGFGWLDDDPPPAHDPNATRDFLFKLGPDPPPGGPGGPIPEPTSVAVWSLLALAGLVSLRRRNGS